METTESGIVTLFKPVQLKKAELAIEVTEEMITALAVQVPQLTQLELSLANASTLLLLSASKIHTVIISTNRVLIVAMYVMISRIYCGIITLRADKPFPTSVCAHTQLQYRTLYDIPHNHEFNLRI
jgi:hypothetical protein